jgi:excisionase family DNA binding protein
MGDERTIERHRVYTRDEAAALMRMSALEMDDLLQAANLPVVDTGRRSVYLGEVLLRAVGADFSARPAGDRSAREIYPWAVYTDEQAADLLRVTPRTLRKMSDAGRLKSARIGDRVRYLGEELLRFMRGMPA